MTINAGTFVLSGVEVRNNKGKGIWTPSNRTVGYTVTGCRIVDNGEGANLSGQGFIINGNVFRGNANGDLTLNQPDDPHVVANNMHS